jgi:pseudaminic acid synthase
MISCNGRRIGPTQPVFIIAELSGNHNGSIERAKQLIRAAKAAGADAVKLQTYTADTLTIDADTEWFRIKGGLWDGRTLYELYQQAATPWQWHAELFTEAKAAGLHCFSTPFDETSVDFLEKLGCPIYKIASFEIIDVVLIKRIAATRKPVIMSTGMATIEEIGAAVDILRANGCPGFALLNCVSAYPAPPEQMHLQNIGELARRFDCPAGLSDHTLSQTSAIAAVALGACVLEKHLCLKRADGGPDAGFSLEPEEFAALVSSIREAEKGVRGAIGFGPTKAEKDNLVFRRSIFVVRDVEAGALLSAADLRVIRPGYGLPPVLLADVIGRRAKLKIARGTPLTWDAIS